MPIMLLCRWVSPREWGGVEGGGRGAAKGNGGGGEGGGEVR